MSCRGVTCRYLCRCSRAWSSLRGTSTGSCRASQPGQTKFYKLLKSSFYKFKLLKTGYVLNTFMILLFSKIYPRTFSFVRVPPPASQNDVIVDRVGHRFRSVEPPSLDELFRLLI